MSGPSQFLSRRLVECGDLLSGGTPNRGSAHFWGGTIPWISAKSLNQFEIGDSEDRLSDAGAAETTLVPSQSILFVVRGMSLASEFRVGITQRLVAFNQDVRALVPYVDIDARYLARFLQASSDQILTQVDYASHGTARLTSDRFENIKVPLPPLDEQRRIAEILDRADALRAKRRASLAQLDTLAQSIFLAMFGHPDARDSKWPVATLKQLGCVSTGRTPPGGAPGMFNGDVPFMTPGDLESREPTTRTLTAAGAQKSVTVRAGATLVCCIGATIGKMARVNGRVAFNQQINAVEWGPSVDDIYAFVALGLLKSRIVAAGTSTTLPILKKSAFERLEIPVPPLASQRAFAARCIEIDRLHEQFRASALMLDALFASLQHRAFRGEL